MTPSLHSDQVTTARPVANASRRSDNASHRRKNSSKMVVCCLPGPVATLGWQLKADDDVVLVKRVLISLNVSVTGRQVDVTPSTNTKREVPRAAVCSRTPLCNPQIESIHERFGCVNSSPTL